MQLVWSRIWTRVAVSISNDDNHYTTATSTAFIPSANILFTPSESICTTLGSPGLLHFIHGKGKEKCNHDFPKGINTKWTQIPSERLWTRLAGSIFCADNHYTTGIT